MLEHVAGMHDFYGADTGLKIARKHIAAYFRHFDCEAWLPPLLSAEVAHEQLERLERCRAIAIESLDARGVA